MVTSVKFSEPAAPLVEGVEQPFALLLDADDQDWRDEEFLRRSSLALLEAGCRWFVCFGQRSETLHDRIDDTIVEKDYQSVVTTYHLDESEEEVAQFFKEVALMEMKGGLVLVRDKSRWAPLFE